MAGMNQNADPEFINIIQSAITYWIEKVNGLKDDELESLDDDRLNINQIITFGLGHEDVVPLAGQLCAVLFNYIERRGFWEEWMIYIQNALGRLSDEEDALLAFQLELHLAQLENRTRQPKQAEERVGRLLHQVEKLGETEILAEVYRCLAGLATDRREFEQAKMYALKSYEIFQQYPNSHKSQALVLNLLGIAHHHLNEFEEAREYFSMALAKWERLNQSLWMARTLINFAYCLSDAEDFRAASIYYNDALEILEETKYEFEKAVVHINRGLLFSKQQHWEDSILEFQLANSPFLQNSPHAYHQALIYSNMAFAHLKMGEIEKARHYIDEAISMRRNLGYNIGLANSLSTAGQIAIAEGKIDEAVDNFEEGLQLVKDENPGTFGGNLKRELEEHLAQNK